MATTVAARRRQSTGPYSWVPTLEDAREAAAAIAGADPRVRAILAFGSVARGEARSGSDIDLVVVVAADPADIGRAAEELGEAAEFAAGRRVDLLVRTGAEWEHLVGCVPSSVESAAAAEAVVLYENPAPAEPASDSIDAVARGDLDNAAAEAAAVRDQMNALRGSLAGIATQEADLAGMAAAEAAAEREGRYRHLLQTAHMAIERSIAAVRAAVDGGGYRSGHDLDAGLEELADTAERRALAEALRRARTSDGKLMNWRRGAYAARERDFAADTSAERSADWVAAAAGCAQIAAAALAERADADDQAQVAAALAAAARRVEEAPADAAAIETGPAPTGGPAMPEAEPNRPEAEPNR